MYGCRRLSRLIINVKTVNNDFQILTVVNGNVVNFNVKRERTSPRQSESPDETSRTVTPDSATNSDDADDIPTSLLPIFEQSSSNSVESNIVLLMKVFPHVEKQILMMILKAYENNVIKAIESLVQDNARKQCTTPVPLRVPNMHHLPPQIPMQRLPMFQPFPHSPPFTSPPPRMLQASGLQFTAFYPGHPGQINTHVPNPLGFNPRMLQNPCTFSGNKNQWWLAIPNQSFNKRPLVSRTLVSPSAEISKSGLDRKCTECQNILNISDRFCSRCGTMVPANN